VAEGETNLSEFSVPEDALWIRQAAASPRGFRGGEEAALKAARARMAWSRLCIHCDRLAGEGRSRTGTTADQGSALQQIKDRHYSRSRIGTTAGQGPALQPVKDRHYSRSRIGTTDKGGES
jgi:hypothetical protein